jgi:16S rRNA (uracil1498-N3)-methyltransferase
VNLLLLLPEDFISATRARISGRRLDEVRRIGEEHLRVGVIDGRIGTATIVGEGELDVRLDADPPPPLPLTLVLALPRPKVLNRVIAGATSMGIKKIFLINAWRVEKSYWKSPKLLHLRDQAILGLEQACDTVMPQIETRRFFRNFVEEFKPDPLALVAHPGAAEPCPHNVQQPVTLAIGPEGGFIAEEIASLERVGFRPVHFGPRILRVETAVAAIVGRLI